MNRIRFFSFLMIVFFSSTIVHAAIIRVSPLDNKIDNKKMITNGDILNVQITSDDQINWKSLKLKNLGDIFYILEINNIAQEIAEAKVLVVPPQNPKYDQTIKLDDKKYQVDVVGFETKWVEQKPLQEYLTIITQHKLSSNYLAIILLALLTMLLVGYFLKGSVRKYLIKKKRLRNLKAEQAKLMNTMNTAINRQQLEKVYLLKSKIKKVYSVDNDSFNRFIRQMNAIQYRPDWTDEDLALAKQSLENMKNDLKEKRGI